MTERPSHQVAPNHADVIIIGGGVIGCSVAWHLCQRGHRDVVLLERNQLTCGTTWHAAGLVGTVRSSESLSKLLRYCTDSFIPEIEKETGQSTGYRQVGSLWTATDEERWQEILRLHDNTKIWGPDTELLDVDGLLEHYPLLNPDGLIGGMMSPHEGWVSPVDFTMAIAKGARMGGARLLEGISVTNIETENGQVAGVITDQGRIQTKTVVNCAGLWSRDIGRLVGVDIPLYACEHYYIVTEKSDKIPYGLPVLRDQSKEAYYKEDAGSLLLGAFERKARPIDVEEMPKNFNFDELPGDMDHFMPVLENAIERVPLLGDLGLRKVFCGPESFTPDDMLQLGEAPGLRGFFMACGLNSVGIQSAPGMGKALADWIVDGYPPMDLTAQDVRRNEPFQNTKVFLRERVSETLGLLYDYHFPYRQFTTGRGARRSPLHEQLKTAGACFGNVSGYERANWFAAEGIKPEYDYSYLRLNWLQSSRNEHMAFREGLGIIDLSSFATFEVSGHDACDCLQHICSANVDRPTGSVIYTHWLNERGGIEADLTVTRLTETVFRVVTGPGVRVRDLDWLRRHIPQNAHCHVTDISAGTAIIGVMGPKSRAFLEDLSGADLSNEAFGFSTGREIEIGYARLLAQRISFVGELGWELHIEAEFAPHVFETLLEAGTGYNAKLCGMHALDSCRIEKGFVHYGHEVSSDETPFMVGLGFVCDMSKGDFIGREAALIAKPSPQAGCTRRMVCLLAEDPNALIFGHEPLLRNGDVCGYISSGGYGHALGGAVALGWVKCADGVTKDYIESGTYTVLCSGKPVAVKASLRPFYDPKGGRMRE